MTAKIPPDAFEFYVGLGTARSYQAVADHYGVTKRAITKHASRENWQVKVSEIEKKARETSETRALESLEAMNDRHLKSLRVIQGKALEALRAQSLTTAIEAVRALDLSIKQERTIRGEPASRTAVSIEETIRSEYERWMSDDEDETDQQDGLLH